MTRHTAANCHGYYHHQVDSPLKMTLRDVLKKPSDATSNISRGEGRRASGETDAR